MPSFLSYQIASPASLGFRMHSETLAIPTNILTPIYHTAVINRSVYYRNRIKHVTMTDGA